MRSAVGTVLPDGDRLVNSRAPRHIGMSSASAAAKPPILHWCSDRPPKIPCKSDVHLAGTSIPGDSKRREGRHSCARSISGHLPKQSPLIDPLTLQNTNGHVHDKEEMNDVRGRLEAIVGRMVAETATEGDTIGCGEDEGRSEDTRQGDEDHRPEDHSAKWTFVLDEVARNPQCRWGHSVPNCISFDGMST